MARHNNESRLMNVPKRISREHKLLYSIIVLQIIHIIILVLK